MNILLKAATILDSDSDFHQKKVDIKISNGVIVQISDSISADTSYKEISLENVHISRGWFDSSVSFGEPGYEERETLENGLRVAALSGFSGIALQPNTHPVTDSNASIGFLKNSSRNHSVDLFPIGALTRISKGKDLAELYDMKNAGAVAFGDYQKAIQNPNLLKIALQYAQGFHGLVLSFPQDAAIAGKGIVNEGKQSTLLGLKGIPELAEKLQITRDLFLLSYTGGKLHIPTISTAGSVELIREAKRNGLAVSCSVSVHHLTLTDTLLDSFDTRYKVLPPLRTDKDIKVLLEGIKDGTIDMVTSDHQPIDIENKKIEFDNALYGTIGLETAFGMLNNTIDTLLAIELLTKGKDIFGIKNAKIAEGEKANLTLFNPEGTSIFSKKDVLSKSLNSAFFDQKMKGRVYGIINNNQIVLKETI